jgi:hypothetical protein
MSRLKRAELTSGVGALVLGLGLGALFPHVIGAAAGAVVLVGLALHAFGMWDKHRQEALGHAVAGGWVIALRKLEIWMPPSHSKPRTAWALQQNQHRRDVAGHSGIKESTWRKTSPAECKSTRRKRPEPASTTGRLITSVQHPVRPSSTPIRLSSRND